MADRYFDRNGTSAGFGTLTGAWDTTTASWSTSAAGTATPASFTFGTSDAAYFGSATVSNTTPGTATISTGVTVNLNGIYTRNLTGGQTVAAAGTGALVFGGTAPFVDLGQTLTVSAPVSGSAGLVVNSSSATYALSLTGSTSGLTGDVTVNGGRVVVAGSARTLPSTLAIASTAEFTYGTFSDSFTFPVAPTGLGLLGIGGDTGAGTGCTFPVGYLSSFGGTVGVLTFPATNQKYAKVRFYELPPALRFIAYGANTTPLIAADFLYLGDGHTASTSIVVDSITSTVPAGLTSGTYTLANNGTVGPVVLSGTVQRTNTSGIASARMNLTLGGSNTGDNTLSGTISEVGTNSAILGITKVDAGRWVLSGTNTYTGLNTISAGTLSAQSAAALGSATSTGGVTISGTGVLELAGGITLNKSVTDFTVSNATNPVQSVGDNTLQTKQLTLSVTPTFTVGSGDKLTLAPQGAGVIVGSGTGITKAGDGELALGNTNNTFTGAVAVNAGTLTVHNVFSQGAAQNLGQSTTAIPLAGTLKFIGASGFMNRSLTLTGPTPALDCSGSGNFEFQNATQTNEARTFTLTGTSTGVNEVKFALPDTSFATGLAKDGTGNWTVSGALSYSGATDVNEGTLRLVRADGNTMTGAVTVDAGATLELVTDTLPGSSGAAGRVLGTGNVTVNGDVKTRGGVVQKGQMRYGGNLTFGSGSKLYIGAAA